MDIFYDCHSHEVYGARKGFLIAVDGVRGSSGGYCNREVMEAADRCGMVPVQYVVKGKDRFRTKIIKVHPRRERLAVEEVEAVIMGYQPHGVIVDTLNQPYWVPNDYWKLALKFPKIQFLFAHAGGFDIVDFLKIAMFQGNAWIDFSFTQHFFGWCGSKVEMPMVAEAIRYAMEEPAIYKKVMLGSDNLRGETDCFREALESYQIFHSYRAAAKDNFESFMEKCRL